MIFSLIVGIILLVAGRRLYWFFLGAVGFFFVFDFVSRAFPHQPHNTVIIIALVAGVIGALLAVLLQKIALVIGGFFAGGHFLVQALQQTGALDHGYYWILFVAGGIIGAVLMRIAFSFALILLSSIAGATLVLRAVHLDRPGFSIPFILLAVFGIAAQYGLLRFKPPREKQ